MSTTQGDRNPWDKLELSGSNGDTLNTITEKERAQFAKAKDWNFNWSKGARKEYKALRFYRHIKLRVPTVWNA